MDSSTIGWIIAGFIVLIILIIIACCTCCKSSPLYQEGFSVAQRQYMASRYPASTAPPSEAYLIKNNQYLNKCANLKSNELINGWPQYTSSPSGAQQMPNNNVMSESTSTLMTSMRNVTSPTNVSTVSNNLSQSATSDVPEYFISTTTPDTSKNTPITRSAGNKFSANNFRQSGMTPIIMQENGKTVNRHGPISNSWVANNNDVRAIIDSCGKGVNISGLDSCAIDTSKQGQPSMTDKPVETFQICAANWRGFGSMLNTSTINGTTGVNNPDNAGRVKVAFNPDVYQCNGTKRNIVKQ